MARLNLSSVDMSGFSMAITTHDTAIRKNMNESKDQLPGAYTRPLFGST